MAATPASNLWRAPSGTLVCFDDVGIVSHQIDNLDGDKTQAVLHIGYKQGGHIYLYREDADWAYKVLDKGAHDVETA